MAQEIKVEPHVVCRKCHTRIRANTANNTVYCDCCKTRVKGNDKFFTINNHLVVMENISKYSVSDDSLNELW